MADHSPEANNCPSVRSSVSQIGITNEHSNFRSARAVFLKDFEQDITNVPKIQQNWQ